MFFLFFFWGGGEGGNRGHHNSTTGMILMFDVKSQLHLLYELTNRQIIFLCLESVLATYVLRNEDDRYSLCDSAGW